jgi:hypothetical protein
LDGGYAHSVDFAQPRSNASASVQCYRGHVTLGARDTRPDIEERMLELYRAMTPQEKAVRIFDLNGAARALSAARIQKDHPELSEREVEVRVAALVYGRDLVRRAVGIDPGPEYE